MKYSYELSISPEKEKDLIEILLKKTGIRGNDLKSFEILKKSIDARKKPDITLKYTLLLEFQNPEAEKKAQKRGAKPSEERVVYAWPEYVMEEGSDRPVIVGFGPAGIFASLYLARAGKRPIVIERGGEMNERISAVNNFHKGGNLNINTNVQFGEGGAGTFSDGKLNTGVKDKFGRNRAVLEVFHEFGAPEEILYDGRAHIGTDVIRKVVVNIRKEIERLGGEVRFNTQFVKPDIKDGKICGVYVKSNKPQEKRDAVSENELNYGFDNKGEYIPCSSLILAIGHSARDTYEMLHSMNFRMEAKAFAVGFRVIHKAKYINECQYGERYEDRFPNLPTAYYKLTYQAKTGKNVYSFCMCPGGYVVNASSEEGRLAVNGMSDAARDGEYSNAAMVMNVGPEDFGNSNVLAGMHYQRKLEETAFKLGEGKIPVQFYKDFENTVRQKENESLENDALAKNAIEKADYIEIISIKEINGLEKSSGIYGDIKSADLTKLFTDNMNRSFIEGMQHFNYSMKGYADVNPLLCGVESRTSAPIRILRDEEFQSLSVKGIFPCGEGAGYAGGITSAAIDGLKVAEAVVNN